MSKAIRKALEACASYSKASCIFDNPCRVFKGERCAWFEESVLPDAWPSHKCDDKWKERERRDKGEARLQYQRTYVKS